MNYCLIVSLAEKVLEREPYAQEVHCYPLGDNIFDLHVTYLPHPDADAPDTKRTSWLQRL